MTGLGDDGAHGLLEMKQARAYTIAQDEESSIVFGMPWEAIKLNAVDKVLSLKAIGGNILRQCDSRSHLQPGDQRTGGKAL